MTISEKRCKVCGVEKPITEFYRAAGMADGHRSDCRECNLAARRERYLRDPEPARARTRAWQKANPERYADRQAQWRASGGKAASDRRSHLRRAFALTETQYQGMLLAQGSVCAICRTPPKPGANLDVDHDHQTGAVRGLLCRNCNHGLGKFDDDIVNLFRAVEYLTGGVLLPELTYYESATPAG